MKMHSVIDHLYQSLLEQLDKVQVVLLHPTGSYRSVLVAKLANDPNIKAFYYAMGPDDIDIQSFVNSAAHDIALQHPTFGRHISALPNSIYEDFNTQLYTIINEFARDIDELSDQEFVLILDEFDRSDLADDVQRFVERLALHLPPQCRLVVNSRTLPRLSWVSLIAQNRASMLLNDTTIEENFYGLPNSTTGDLEVYALGPGFVQLNNQFIDSWEGHLPRLLFFFALDRPVVTRSDICGSFWPELNAEQAVNVFHVTKRRLHKALDVDVLVHYEGYYRVNPDLNIYYDVLEFVAALLRGRNPNNTSKIEAYQRVIDIYRGPFLQGHEDYWIKERRIDFRAGYVEALKFMSNIWYERHKPEQSLALLQKALSEDLKLDDVNAEVMRLYAQLGRRNEAASHYQRVLQVHEKDQTQPAAVLHLAYQEISG